MTGPSPKPPHSQRLRALLPEVWSLMRPRRGVLALALVLMAVNRVAGLVLPGSTKLLVDDVIGARRVDLLLPLVAGVVTATIIQGGTSFALTQLLSKAAQRLIAEMRRKVQAHVGLLPVAYYDASKSGTLVSRIMNDVEGVRNLIGTGLVELAGGVITAALALVVMLRLSPVMTSVTFLSLVTCALVFERAFRTLRPIFRERGKIYAEVTGRLTESLGGVRVVKGYRAEPREAAVFSEGVGRLLANVLKTLTATSVLGLSSTVLLGFVGAAVMYVGGREVLAGRLTVGGFFTYTVFLGFLVAPVFQIVSIGTQLTEALAGLERTREVLGERPEDQDPRRTVPLASVRGQVEFEQVVFAYEPDRPVLEGLSFQAAPGTVTALVGPSGAGKSTIIGLVCAFHTPNGGRILVDGADLTTVTLASYRSRLGVVLQETFLFDGTIRENVAFSRPEASEEDVLAACRIARVDEFAEGFPEKYDTVVGERGVKLSGGQKQRVSIARAILADPRILILDEATSSLDSESEAIRRADQILVVEKGRIVERGTHPALYGARGRYFEMYTRQHGVESNLFLAPGEGEKAGEAEAPEPAPAGGPAPPRFPILGGGA